MNLLLGARWWRRGGGGGKPYYRCPFGCDQAFSGATTSPPLPAGRGDLAPEPLFPKVSMQLSALDRLSQVGAAGWARPEGCESRTRGRGSAEGNRAGGRDGPPPTRYRTLLPSPVPASGAPARPGLPCRQGAPALLPLYCQLSRASPFVTRSAPLEDAPGITPSVHPKPPLLPPPKRLWLCPTPLSSLSRTLVHAPMSRPGEIPSARCLSLTCSPLAAPLPRRPSAL